MLNNIKIGMCNKVPRPMITNMKNMTQMFPISGFSHSFFPIGAVQVFKQRGKNITVTG